MKTDDLVTMLATGVTPVPRHAASRSMGLALLGGGAVSLAMLVFGYGIRRDVWDVLDLPMFWVKLLFPLCIAVSAGLIVHRLARPGARLQRAWWGLAVPVLLMLAGAVVSWWGTPEQDRVASLLGQSWRTCALNIGLVALPVFVAALLALRGLAPTRRVWAGAAAGALAGGFGAAVYALYCVEMSAPFVAVWYAVGVLLPTVAGALVGRRWLVW